jgi:predicted nucleotidyltransferase
MRKPLRSINEKALRLAKDVIDRRALPDAPSQFVFLTLSGAHIYGFPSLDSDLDIRGAHLLPLDVVTGLVPVSETYESTGIEVEGTEVDCVSHDLKKYLTLLTKKNGYVLEQIFSSLVVFDDGSLDEIRRLAQGAMTRHVVHHYRGFFRKQVELVLKEESPTAKSVLYLFRVVMTGLHLLRTGEVVTDVNRLNGENHRMEIVRELVSRKMESGEKQGRLRPEESKVLLAEARKLEAQLLPESESSSLPETVENLDDLNRFLVRRRIKS